MKVLDNKNECNILNSSPNANINYDFFINEDGAVIIEDRDLSLDISYEIKNTEHSDQNIIKELLSDNQVTSDVQCTIQTEECIIKNNVQAENESASTSSTLLDKVPPVFKKCLFWPKENTLSVKKRQMKDRIPSVITSELGLKYLQEKEDKKRDFENQKVLKKSIQLEKMKIKKEKDEEKERKKN